MFDILICLMRYEIYIPFYDRAHIVEGLIWWNLIDTDSKQSLLVLLFICTLVAYDIFCLSKKWICMQMLIVVCCCRLVWISLIPYRNRQLFGNLPGLKTNTWH